MRLLVRDGALVEDPDQPWLNLQDPDTLDPLSAASIRNLTRYHGVFAPSASFRTRVTPAGAPARRRRAVAKTDRDEGCESPAGKYDRTDELLAPLTWAQRLRRVFDIDIATCPLCGGTLRVISDVTDPAVIATVLEHLRIRAESRAPPRRTESHTKDRLNTAS